MENRLVNKEWKAASDVEIRKAIHTGTLIVYKGEDVKPYSSDASNALSEYDQRNKITDVIIHPGTAKIEKYAFDHTKITNMTIPEGVEHIGDYALGQCYDLVEITFPESLVSFGYRAFYWCDNLTKVDLSDTGVTVLGKELFYQCKKLTTIKFPKGLETIERFAFSDITKEGRENLCEMVRKMGDSDPLKAQKRRDVRGLTETPKQGRPRLLTGMAEGTKGEEKMSLKT